MLSHKRQALRPVECPQVKLILTLRLQGPTCSNVSYNAMQSLRMGAVEVIENFWHYRYVENPGAAWGFMADVSDSFRTPFFIIVSFVAMGLMIHFFRSSHPQAKLFRVALAMVMGGAIGNLLDRIRLGYVIDFIDWHWYQHHWPTFNVADAFISVGVALLVLDMIINGNLYDEKTSPAEP